MSVTSITTSNLEALLYKIPDLTPNDRAIIEKSYHKAEAAHEGQFRKSGEPYFTHCVAVAEILAEMHLDAEAIAAALMHDVIEDTDITYDEIKSEFGKTIADLVDGVTKLTKLPINVEKDSRRPRDSDRELEYIRKMLLTMGDDVRIVLIKLADRLHNMRTLTYMPEHKQVRTARETMDIFAPLANRLGIWQIKWELEDLCFRYLDPDSYRSIASSIDERRADREAYLKRTIVALEERLVAQGLEQGTITARPKHIYSIHRKMRNKQLPFDEIFDVRAVRIIVHTIPECYLALGVVHNFWRPIVQEFDDYVAAPKDNFYQSLHTAVIDGNGKTIEIQIRTWEMHEHAEYGVAAHWRYKEGRRHDEKFEKRLNYLRRLMEFGPEVEEDPETFVDRMKAEVFQDRVYVYTPKGDIIDLPVGATPIDMAYHIHTEIGHRCRGAKVNGKLVGLDYKLRTGDQIVILTSKRGGPSMDWLNSDLGYVKTSRARGKIRYWFRKLNRDKHIALGRDVVERELKRVGVLDSMTFESVANLFKHDTAEDFMAAVGAGEINAAQIAHRVLDEEHNQQRFQDVTDLVRRPRVDKYDNDKGITIRGTGGLMTNIAVCCHPAPGEKIVGYITRGRGVTIHRQDCPNILAHTEPERLIEVDWGQEDDERRFAVPVEVVAYDRPGLIRDISSVIADERVNIAEVQVSTRQEIATFHITMEISDNRQLNRILNKIEQLQSVVETYRCNTI
jgi:GTP diphosphokinase / guanosine-3',5'-bis(diphosphate) 3'-diphosphatase